MRRAMVVLAAVLALVAGLVFLLSAAVSAPPHCPELKEGAYEPHLTAASASPGERVQLVGRLPQYNKAGVFTGTDAVEVWWNLDSSHWDSALLGHPSPQRHGQVFKIIRTDDVGPCEYKIDFKVPNAEAGDHDIVVLVFGGGGAAGLGKVTLNVARK